MDACLGMSLGIYGSNMRKRSELIIRTTTLSIKYERQDKYVLTNTKRDKTCVFIAFICAIASGNVFECIQYMSFSTEQNAANDHTRILMPTTPKPPTVRVQA